MGIMHGNPDAMRQYQVEHVRTGRARACSPDEGLQLISISKSFRKHRVLRDVCLSVRPGEIVGLMGPDGAGKSTCFEIILGLQKPDSGRILLNGTEITHLPTYRRAIMGLGYLAQEPGIYRGLTVEQNVRSALEISEPDPQTRAARLEHLLGEFHLDHLRERKANQLSGGERRRCEVVRALASDPSIVLLDEPFAGIDPLTIEELEKLIHRMTSEHRGILITDYNLHEMIELIQRAYVLVDGEVVFHGTPDTLVNDGRVQEAYLGGVGRNK